MTDSAIDLSIPRALSPEPILSIDYCPEDSNENSCGIQDSGFDHGIGSDPVNQGEDEDLDDTVEVDVESVSHQDDLVEDNPVPVECSTPTRSRSCTPAPSASSRQSSPARSDTSSRGNNSSRGNIPSSPIPSTSAPAQAAPDRGSEVLLDVYSRRDSDFLSPVQSDRSLHFIQDFFTRRRNTSVCSEPPLKCAKTSSPGAPRRRVTWSHCTDHLRHGLRPRRVTVTVYTGFTKIASPRRKRTSWSSSLKLPDVSMLAEDPGVPDPGMNYVYDAQLVSGYISWFILSLRTVD